MIADLDGVEFERGDEARSALPGSMNPSRRILVIGAATLRDAAQRALPGVEVALADHPLDGVWRGGHESFDGVLISLSIGQRALAAGRGLRKVAASARIIMSSAPADEPHARRAVEQFADDYVIEPLDDAELRRAFPTLASDAPASDSAPSADELVQLGDVLRWMSEGPRATVRRLAALVRGVFRGDGVTIELDGISETDGVVGANATEESIFRNGHAVGRLAMSVGRGGSPSGPRKARLEEYARLIGTIVQQSRQQHQLQELAWTDDLSGLRNRRYFEAQLDHLLKDAIEQRLRITVMMFDIDNFKAYNDQHGHAVGDALIREVSMLLTRCTRERDIVTRFGGDEFVVVFWDSEKPRQPGSEHPREPIALAERFCQAIADHSFQCLGDRAPGPVTISGGLACFPWNGTTREQLLKAADDALLAAKRTGKNRMQLAGGARQDAAPFGDGAAARPPSSIAP